MENKGLVIDAAPEKTFYLVNGKHIRNLVQLVSELESLSHDGFLHHCNFHKDDFATWIEDALGMHKLASTLRGIKDRNEYIKAINAEIHPPPTVAINLQKKEPHSEIIHDVHDIPHVHNIPALPNIPHIIEAQKTPAAVPKIIPLIKTVPKEIPKGNKEIRKESKDTKEVRDAPKEHRKDVRQAVREEHSQEPKREVILDIVERYSRDLAKLKATADHTEKMNSELAKKIESIEKINSELNKKVENYAKINSEFVRKFEDVKRSNSELIKKTDTLNRNLTDSSVPSLVTKNVSKYFEDPRFKDKMVETFGQIVVDLHAKDRNTLKSEINSVINLNEQLDKKLQSVLSNRSKMVERIAHESVSAALNSRVSALSDRIDKMMETKITKLGQSFDKKAEDVSAMNLVKFKNDINMEKHDLRSVASEVMRKEFEKVFDNDEYLSKIVAKYQKMFNESAEHLARTHKEYQGRFNDTLIAIRDKIAVESQGTLNRQLTETIKKQREVLDAELAKALSSNKFFVSRFEKEISSREKMLLEAADRKLEENYKRHEGMLRAEFDKYRYETRDLKLQFDKDFKTRETQFNDSINSKIHESMNKEFNDILTNQRNELAETIGTVRTTAVNKIEVEFSALLSKHKEFMTEQFNKAAAEQKALKDKFISELKSEEEKTLSKVRELTKKDIASVLNTQRELLDKELTKTVLANQYFVERFEKEIIEMSRKLTESAHQTFEANYTKHKDMLQTSHAKQIEAMKSLAADADTNIANKESKVYANLNAIIPATVREAVNKEFSRLILEEKQALEAELQKAKETNASMELKLETELQAKAQQLIDTVQKDANDKFSVLIALQQTKLDQELARARKSHDEIEDKKNEIIEKANTFLENMDAYSTGKLKELEREHDKHMKKVSQISVLITKAETALNEVKELKAEVNTDKKNVTKESKEYEELMAELTELRNNLAREKTWISMYRAKANLYTMIHKCSDYIKLKDAHNARLMYNKIAESYARIPFEPMDKAEVYNAASVLLKEIHNTFGNALKPRAA